MGFIVAASTIMILGLLYALRSVFLVCHDTGEGDALFDRVLLSVPTAALSECNRQAEQMFSLAGQILQEALALFQQYDPARVHAVLKGKRELDCYEERLSNCIAQISGSDLMEWEVRQRIKLNLTIGSIQALGSCAVKLEKLAEKGYEKEAYLTKENRRDLLVVSEAMAELISLLIQAYRRDDSENLQQIKVLRQVLQRILQQLKTSVIVCLKNETVSADLCYVLSCVYMDCEDILEIVHMIQDGMVRTTIGPRAGKKGKGRMCSETSDQAVFTHYTIKYSI